MIINHWERIKEDFIYALSADETSSVLAAPRHAITALLSCRFKCSCLPRRQQHFHGNADRAYNTLHFASKVVCQRGTFGNPVLSECVATLPPKRKISGYNLLLNYSRIDRLFCFCPPVFSILSMSKNYA